MKRKRDNTISLILVAIVLVAASAIVIVQHVRRIPQVKVDQFAKCVTQAGLTMYGASWCEHCRAEKVAFGTSFQYIDYVECTADPRGCARKGIEGYPTWLDRDGKQYMGEQGVSGLAKITSCPLPSA